VLFLGLDRSEKPKIDPETGAEVAGPKA